MSDSLMIVCPHCHAVNRVVANKLVDAPSCGKCHFALFNAQAVELNASSFVKHLQRNDIPLLIDFWAPWCGPCQMMAPQFVQAAEMLEPQLRLAKVNTEQEQTLGAQFAIRSIPTMVLFHQGREVARQSGAMNASGIVQWVRGIGR